MGPLDLGRLAVRTALGRTAETPDEHLLLGTHVVVRESVTTAPEPD